MEINADIVNLDSPINEKKVIEFKDYLIESIEEVLSFSQVVLNFLELNTGFKKDEILVNPNVFCCELEDLFGAGAKGIEDMVIERLYTKINQKYRRDREKGFKEYIAEALEYYTTPY